MEDVLLDMRRGLIESVKIPKGVRVIIRDYDVDGICAEDLKTDEAGKHYLEIIHD